MERQVAANRHSPVILGRRDQYPTMGGRKAGQDVGEGHPLCVQASFVKKVDPSNRSTVFFVFGTVCLLVRLLAPLPDRVGAALLLGGIALLLTGIFEMRRSLERYYNSTEPLGLKLNWVMTVLFHAAYFQYHFQRIAEHKRTRCLP